MRQAHAAQAYPPASILEKLAAVDAAAPAVIFGGISDFARARRKAEREEIAALLKITGRKHFWQGFREGLGLLWTGAALPRRVAMMPDDNGASTGAAVGDDLRAAIRSYLDEHPGLAERAGLTDADRRALEPLAIVSPVLVRLREEAGVQVPAAPAVVPRPEIV